MFILAVIFLFGAIIGSFLNVVILRLPKEQELSGRSRCIHCKHELGAFDLVPIFSFFWLAGKCRYCKKNISWRYPFIEILSGSLLTIGYLFYTGQQSDPNILGFLRIAFIIFVSIIVFAIDYEHYLILDKVIFPSILVLFILNFFLLRQSQAATGLLSGLVLAAFFLLLHLASAGRWMGLGDVKLAVFLGLATPFPLIFINLFLAFGVGAAVGIILMLLGQKNFKSQLPFGTFLSLSTVMTVFFGQQLLDWYLRVIGF